MRRDFKIIIAILALGVVISALTAPPAIGVSVSESVTETRSDIFFTYTTVKYPAKAEIINPENLTNVPIGINVDTDEIDFGVVLGKGGSVKKQINLTTRDGLPSKISVKAYGNIAPLLNFDRNEFMLNGHDTIYVLLDTKDYPGGNYTGEVDVVIQRSNNGITRSIIGY